jgi:hypothetical protein
MNNHQNQSQNLLCKSPQTAVSSAVYHPYCAACYKKESNKITVNASFLQSIALCSQESRQMRVLPRGNAWFILSPRTTATLSPLL